MTDEAAMWSAALLAAIVAGKTVAQAVKMADSAAQAHRRRYADK